MMRSGLDAVAPQKHEKKKILRSNRFVLPLLNPSQGPLESLQGNETK